MSSNTTTLERRQEDIQAGLQKIKAMEVLCWPHDGRVWAVLNHNRQVTHAMPCKIPQDSIYTSQEEYAASCQKELSQYGKVIDGIMAFVAGRYYFKPIH